MTLNPRIKNKDEANLLWMCCSFSLLHLVYTHCGPSRCGVDGPVATHREHISPCPITMPDNPYRRGDPFTGDIIPCQLEIRSNCTGFCNIQLNFNKFELPDCGLNVTNSSNACDLIDSCEYVLLHELGIDPNGANYSQLTHFHGNYTRQKYVSRTDKVLLQFCYRSETFSGRNIQMEYRTFNPFVHEPFYAGPVSVYILCFLVILFIGAICLIRWNKTVRQCLEPPPEGKTRHYAAA